MDKLDIKFFVNDHCCERDICYLAAHPDDAAFSSTALLSCLASNNREVKFIVAFSRSSYTLDGSPPDILTISKRRKEEELAFINLIGASWHVTWLELDDAPLRQEYCADTTCTTQPLSCQDLLLAADIAKHVTGFVSSNAVVFAPLGLGLHVDHRIVRLAALAVVSHSNRELVFYEDLPYAGEYDLDTLNSAILTFARSLGLYLQPVHVTDPDLMKLKLEALKCYPSQANPIDVKSVLEHQSRVDGTIPIERLWWMQNCDPQGFPIC